MPVADDTGPRVKTTIELSDALAKRVREVARREGSTFGTLVEDGLRRVLASRTSNDFRMRNASVDGRGLQPECRDAGWDKLRDALYEPEG